MSNGKKFILIVAAIAIPFILVLGFILGVVIVRSKEGNNIQTEDTYLSIEKSINTPTISQSVNNLVDATNEMYSDRDNFEIRDSETANKVIIGKWEKTKSSSEPQFAETIEFFDDGTYQEIVVTETNDTLIDNGQFSFAAPDRIKFQVNERIYRANDGTKDFKEKKNSIFINDITFLSSTLFRITYDSKDGGLIKKEYRKK